LLLAARHQRRDDNRGQPDNDCCDDDCQKTWSVEQEVCPAAQEEQQREYERQDDCPAEPAEVQEPEARAYGIECRCKPCLAFLDGRHRVSNYPIYQL
jgi:hypothetical protein